MNVRNFLIYGLLAGFVAGIFAFVVAHQVGEPHVEAAIALEEAASDDEAGHSHGDEEEAGHSHGDEEGTEVSRANQRTWGLLTGTLAIGTALGGLVGLVAAVAVGRLGRLTPRQSTALVAAIGFVAFALVPFFKYAPAPPAVGDGDTIGSRTVYYFVFLAISVIAAVLATALAQRLWERISAQAAVLVGGGLYLLVMIVAGATMPVVNELGDFPADVLWSFRISSLFTLAAMWGVIGVVLTALVGRRYDAEVADAERRDLAASL